MPSFADIATQVGLVVFAQTLALTVSTSHPTDAGTPPVTAQVETMAPGKTSAPFLLQTVSTGSREPIEEQGPIVEGKRTDRLVPAESIIVAEVLPAFQRDATGRDRPAGPPPEAIEACERKREGANCTFTGPNGEPSDGKCQAGPRGEPAACVPSDAKRNSPRNR